MAECPFCKTAIDEHLAVNGGTCPNCFGEIPGEDAPTDPGAAVRARQEAQDAKVVQRSRIPAILAAFAVMSIVCGAGFIALRPQPPLPMLDLDSADFDFPEIEIVAAPPEPAPTAAPTPRAPRPQGTGLDRLTQAGDPSLPPTPEPGDGIADAGPGGSRGGVGTEPDADPTRPVPLMGPSFGQSSAIDPGMTIRRNRMTGVTLTDDDQIIEMAKRVVAENTPFLNTCYERQLRTVPDLRGSWRVDWILSPAGTATNITVVGQEVANAELESCVAGKVAEWQFQPIRAEMPMGKTVRFRPSF